MKGLDHLPGSFEYNKRRNTLDAIWAKLVLSAPAILTEFGWNDPAVTLVIGISPAYMAVWPENSEGGSAASRGDMLRPVIIPNMQ